MLLRVERLEGRVREPAAVHPHGDADALRRALRRLHPGLPIALDVFVEEQLQLPGAVRPLDRDHDVRVELTEHPREVVPTLPHGRVRAVGGPIPVWPELGRLVLLSRDEQVVHPLHVPKQEPHVSHRRPPHPVRAGWSEPITRNYIVVNVSCTGAGSAIRPGEGANRLPPYPGRRRCHEPLSARNKSLGLSARR